MFVPVPALSADVPLGVRPPPLPGLSWLSVRDARIVDDQGRRILLRGFNQDSLLEPTMNPAPLDATDATMMRQAGFDVVRLPIAWAYLEPQRGSFNMSYLDTIASTVAMLNAHGLYVVLDMHFLGWSAAYGGSGAPAWATLPIPDIHFGGPSTLGWLLSPAINGSTTYFWITSDWQNELLATWRFVVQRFRDDSGVAGYDIFNEPHALPLLPLRFDKDQMFPFYVRAIDSIATVDPNHLFFLDDDVADDIPTWVVPIHAPNLVYAAHFYTGSLFPPAYTGDPTPLTVHIDELAKEATQLPGALWIGEWSNDPSLPTSTAWIDAALADFARYDAGWAWWQWREAHGWSVRSFDGRSVNQALLRLLARPYVQAQPEGVTSSETPDGAALRIAVSPASEARTIAVSWPGSVRGTPQVDDSCGAHSSWNAAAARVLIDVPASTSCRVEVLAE